MKTISMVTSDVWKEVLVDVNKAVVFIDNACAEILHWNGGLCTLTQAGAVDVQWKTSSCYLILNKGVNYM
jgi:hypothetical protein